MDAKKVNNDVALEYLLAQVVNFAKDVIIITEAKPLDPPGTRIVYVNEAFEQLTGYSKTEVIGLTPRILQGKKTSRRTTAKVRKALEKKTPIHASILNYTKDGKEYWLDMTIVPLFDKQHKITHFAAIERNITKVKLLEARLKILATEDPLTKILNRRSFFKILEHTLVIFKKNETPFSLLLLDIDNFKKINDKYGHLVGDEILLLLCNNIKKIIRKSDVLARYGGEEFIALLPQTNLAEAKMVAAEIKDFFNKNKLLCTNDVPIKATVSIGVTMVSKKDISVKKIVKRADDLLYKAKKAGKNCIMAK